MRTFIKLVTKRMEATKINGYLFFEQEKQQKSGRKERARQQQKNNKKRVRNYVAQREKMLVNKGIRKRANKN